MTRCDHLRRVGILCCHCLRNLAFYLSWYEAGTPFKKEQFWINANGNFLDIVVLEWCKLFGDVGGKNYYSKVIIDPAQFKVDLLAKLELTETEFSDYIKQMRTYRDKFVAHLDELNMFHIPYINIAQKSTVFLYERLLAQEAGNDTFYDAPKSATNFFNKYLAQGTAVYSSLVQTGIAAPPNLPHRTR